MDDLTPALTDALCAYTYVTICVYIKFLTVPDHDSRNIFQKEPEFDQVSLHLFVRVGKHVLIIGLIIQTQGWLFQEGQASSVNLSLVVVGCRDSRSHPTFRLYWYQVPVRSPNGHRHG